MQNKTKIKIFIGVVAVVIIGIFANYIFSEEVSVQGNAIKRVYIRDILVKAELVKTETRIQLGLAGRDGLSEKRGMLFQMLESEPQSFWMKGMRFAIDIIWIENGRVIGCEKNISPEDPRTFVSPGDAGYVLEVPEGFCDENKIRVNDKVKI
ncbi:MAG: DUF192 domain-containing protein [Candidatus Moraniibacteriota bacterium]